MKATYSYSFKIAHFSFLFFSLVWEADAQRKHASHDVYIELKTRHDQFDVSHLLAYFACFVFRLAWFTAQWFIRDSRNIIYTRIKRSSSSFRVRRWNVMLQNLTPLAESRVCGQTRCLNLPIEINWVFIQLFSSRFIGKISNCTLNLCCFGTVSYLFYILFMTKSIHKSFSSLTRVFSKARRNPLNHISHRLWSHRCGAGKRKLQIAREHRT